MISSVMSLKLSHIVVIVAQSLILILTSAQAPDNSQLTAACLLCWTTHFVNNDMINASAHFDDKLISEIFAVAG